MEMIIFFIYFSRKPGLKKMGLLFLGKFLLRLKKNIKEKSKVYKIRRKLSYIFE